MIFMINEENCDNIIKRAYRPQFDGRLVSVTYDIAKDIFSSVIIKKDGTPSTVTYGIEKDIIYSIDKNGNITPIMYICNDPSHPSLVSGVGEDTLYSQISKRISHYLKKKIEYNEIIPLVWQEINPMLSEPNDCMSDGGRLENIRRNIAQNFGNIFNKLDNIAYVTGWFLLDCMHCDFDLINDNLQHYVLCLLALEGIRMLIAMVNQLRVGLASETLVYWRTFYEVYIKSNFIFEKYKEDKNLPGRFLYCTESQINSSIDLFIKDTGGDSINKFDTNLLKHYKPCSKARGDYKWAYPLVKQPTKFQNIINSVDDKKHKFEKLYYRLASEKVHALFLYGDIPPSATGIYSDRFSTGHINRIVDLTMPLLKKLLANTAQLCKKEHELIRNFLKEAIADVEASVKRDGQL